VLCCCCWCLSLSTLWRVCLPCLLCSVRFGSWQCATSSLLFIFIFIIHFFFPFFFLFFFYPFFDLAAWCFDWLLSSVEKGVWTAVSVW
jgi:hypothetical protein